MIRDEHLEFCRRCLNRKFNPSKGIVCGLTGEIAAFEKDCENFSKDHSVVVAVDDQTTLAAREIREKLAPEVFERLRQRQDLTGSLIAGVGAALACAVLRAVFTVYTRVQFGGMALIVGAGVGLAMRRVGRGIDNIFGICGAVVSLVGCLVGNFLTIIGFLAHENDLGYFETLVRFDCSYIGDIMLQRLMCET